MESIEVKIGIFKFIFSISLIFMVFSSKTVPIYALEYPMHPPLSMELDIFSQHPIFALDAAQFDPLHYILVESHMESMYINHIISSMLLSDLQEMHRYTERMNLLIEKMRYLHEMIIAELSHYGILYEYLINIQDDFRLIHIWKIALTSAVIGLLSVQILAKIWSRAT